MRKYKNPVDFAIEELEFRRDMLLELAPATDNPEYMRWKARACEEAIERLRRPVFLMSPFV